MFRIKKKGQYNFYVPSEIKGDLSGKDTLESVPIFFWSFIRQVAILLSEVLKLVQKEYFTLKKGVHTFMLKPKFEPGTSGTTAEHHSTTPSRPLSQKRLWVLAPSCWDQQF